MVRRAGFTLIELSIVLVIIGLIVGGILVGRDLIEAAGRRSVISDVDNFKAANYTFKLKYNCFPGDCNNATQFFGTLDATPATCIATATPNGSTATCNGSGDGVVSKTLTNELGPDEYEMYRFWQHLSAAKLVAGEYTGQYLSPSSLNADKVGTLIPRSRWKNAFGYNYFYVPSTTEWAAVSIYYRPSQYNKQILRLANTMKAWGGGNYGDISTNTIKEFDIKFDDGHPTAGLVQVPSGLHNVGNNPCGMADYTTYVGGSNVETCTLMFVNPF